LPGVDSHLMPGGNAVVRNAQHVALHAAVWEHLKN